MYTMYIQYRMTQKKLGCKLCKRFVLNYDFVIGEGRDEDDRRNMHSLQYYSVFICNILCISDCLFGDRMCCGL